MDQGLQRGSDPSGQRELAARSDLAKPQISRSVRNQTVYLTGVTTPTERLLELPLLNRTRCGQMGSDVLPW
jgi:hypothetical protein